MNTLADNWRDVRRARCPLVLVTTSDPANTIQTIIKAQNGKAAGIVAHDVIRGLVPHNDGGADIIRAVTDSPAETQNTVNCLALIAEGVSKDPDALTASVLFFHNAQRWLDQDITTVQAVWNLRDSLKSVGASLVLLSTTGRVPAELRNDIITIDDPLPGPDVITAIVQDIAKAAKEGGADVDPATIADDRTVDTLTGTSPFGVEQVFSLSLRRTGVDRAVMWERKRRLVEQTEGLAIWQGAETFDDLGGLNNLKDYATAVFTSGRTAIRALGFIDEIEKAFAAAGTDTSGTTQDQNAVFLRVMQDYNIPGIMLLGPPGTGKSAIAKACGSVAKCPVIAFDLGAAKGSLVGESERKIRAMMDVFIAVSQGKGLIIATCNSISALPPELRRRFKLGTFFVDLPGPDERAVIWQIWKKRFGLALDEQTPPDGEWTGAEIAACCEVAYRTGQPLTKAAQFIVPVAVSAGDKITALRKGAEGRFLSASEPGMYRMRTEAAAIPTTTTRAFQFES
jgi:hypothetical protein